MKTPDWKQAHKEACNRGLLLADEVGRGQDRVQDLREDLKTALELLRNSLFRLKLEGNEPPHKCYDLLDCMETLKANLFKKHKNL